MAPSSPVVPHDDPTLLFTNAGMNQFKDVFLGRGTRPYTRAVNSQKCIRAGGKHNDLEDVGNDVYHHTFFEMLGNWSFGDYFKQDSIRWGWELLTRVYGLPVDRLYATYFGGHEASGLEPDTEARDLWLELLPADRVIPGNAKDNFWEMGETGPCGPCSEIHFDRIGGRSAPHLVNSGDPDLLEIWNHVFIQFNREANRTLKLLPAKHVDTGMGLERLVSVLQDKRSNYDTDLWTPIFESIRDETGARPYGGSLTDHTDIAYRVIADHVRCLTVAACDGAGPGAEGRNYVLRRILRRAARHGLQTLGRNDPFIYRLVPAVVATLGDTFPEIRARQNHATDIIRSEEEAFGRTIRRGIALFDDAIARAQSEGTTIISGEDAFKLHDTMGFPVDLTQVMATERGLSVDTANYEARMQDARALSRAGSASATGMNFPPDAIANLPAMQVLPTDDSAKYAAKPVTSRVRAIWTGDSFTTTLDAGQTGALILDRTCFYAESGGQQSDTGAIRIGHVASLADDQQVQEILHGGDSVFEVSEAQSFGPYVLHIGRVKIGRVRSGDSGSVQVDAHRRISLAANHTATHLLNLALRHVAGNEVEQRGSLVSSDRLRFDYAAKSPLSSNQLREVEEIVNTQIEAGLGVFAEETRLAPARAINTLRAVFGERYPDPVRIVSIGAPVSQLLMDPNNARWNQFSVEFCGGTHVSTTREIKHFVLVSEGGLSAGVRRVFALSGVAALAAFEAAGTFEKRVKDASTLGAQELEVEVTELASLETSLGIGATARASIAPLLDLLREKLKESRKQGAEVTRDAALAQARQVIDANAATSVLVFKIDGADAAALMAVLDMARTKCPSASFLVLSPDVEGSKVAIAAACSKDAIAKGLKAGDWVKVAAQACGGSGGGRPDTAQAGGKNPAHADAALVAAREFAAQRGCG